jgi:hypothetical protein
MNSGSQTGWRMVRPRMDQDAAGGTRRRMTFAILKVLWHLTFEPVYRWLFRTHFEAIAGRLEEVAAELHIYETSLRNQSAAISDQSAAISDQNTAISDYGTELRNHIHGLNVRVDDVAARIAALDDQVRTVIAGHWEHEAIVRRLAALEDRMQSGGQDTPSGAP